jgi:hypothetical protein
MAATGPDAWRAFAAELAHAPNAIALLLTAHRPDVGDQLIPPGFAQMIR